jgi:hypothetical protein
MPIRLICLAILLAIGAAGRECLAIDYYVDNVIGNDLLPGTSAQPHQGDGPVATISRALQLAGRSDRIVVANTQVLYHDMIGLSGPHHSGTSERPFVIVGNGAVLDGTVVAQPGAWRHMQGNVFAIRPRRLTYQQLFLAGNPLKRQDYPALFAGTPALQPLEWALADGHLFFCVEDGRAPEFYDLRHAGLQTGITLYNTRHVRIENLVIQGFQQDGINAHELVRNCELVDVECRANGRSGLSVGGVSRVLAVRSHFYDNGRVQVRNEGLAHLALDECDVDDTTAPAYSAQGERLLVDGQPWEAS